MFCPKCGNEVKEGTMFCPKCGNEIKNTQGSAQQNPQPNHNTNKPKAIKKQTIGLIIGVLFICLGVFVSMGEHIMGLALIAVGAVIMFYTREK